ncbi:MAG TPA: beta-galactosidase GalB [Pyrinomonadaceae bacterium]|nr:beta-galactosidase GalB [Pyrinomonadaceae bacterium]
MKNRRIFFSLFVLVFFALSLSAQMRERLSFNEDWRFSKDDPKGAEGVLHYEKIKDWVRASGNEFVLTSDAVKSARPSGNLGENVEFTRKDFNDSAWRKLNLPHDWAIEGDFIRELPGETGKRQFAGIGWYRKHFLVSANDKDKQFYIDFDGAMAYPTVWLNGKFVGGWTYGYSSFRLDLTPYLEFGKENVLSVRLENPPESSRWYPGAGIYRNVWLVKTSKIHVAQWGTFVTTPEVSKDSANIRIDTTFVNKSRNDAEISVKTSVYEIDKNDQKLGKAIAVSENKKWNSSANSNNKSYEFLSIKNPKLWSVKTPNRYLAVTEISNNGEILDVYETPFGIRTIKFDAEKGFLLNGERLYLQGVCNHHDLGALGSALNYRALERQLEIMKEMGVNAIRTSHNPPAPELLELADKMGFVVMDEAFDEWARGKRPNGYNKVFADWHEKDWRSQLRRDRNHPSVILWSTGNEIWEQGTPEGHKISSELRQIAHEEDPTRPTSAGANDTRSGYNGFQKTVDVFGYNYKPKEYAKFREANPNIPLFSSESASTISSRGEYFFPVSDDKSKGLQDFQMSSYDLSAPPWATPPDWEFEGQDKNKFTAGEFVWTGFDYLGEPTPYDGKTKTMPNLVEPNLKKQIETELAQKGEIPLISRSSYFGIVDLAGFKKDRFYIYQARWRPDLPMAHILPHWNWAERVGQITPVHVYTSGDEAELFLNNKSLGRKKRGEFQYRFRWDGVVYEKGELKVVAYKNGKIWAEDVVKTTDSPSQISMIADRANIKADGQDLSFITVKITDKNGLMVPRSKNLIRFVIEGAGEIVATDNGDATDLSSFQSKTRKAYNGMALVIIRSTKKSGKIKLKAFSDGLKTAEITISSK